MSAYHFIEACAARQRVHIMKHQRVPDELRRNPSIVGDRSERAAAAFHFLDTTARAKFVYGETGNLQDLEEAQRAFQLIEQVCREALK